MEWVICGFYVASVIGAYALGWNDHKDQTKADNALAVLDRLLVLKTERPTESKLTP